MRKIVIPYTLKQEKTGHYNLLPLCSLRLHGPTRSVTVTAVVDSGATHSFFPASAARDAGFSLEKGRRFHATFGGSEDPQARIIPVYLNISDFRVHAEVVFVEDLRLGYALLGRHHVFNQFNEVLLPRTHES